jgi:hypothetical protein
MVGMAHPIRARCPITILAGMLLLNGGLKRRIRSPSVSATHKFPFASTVTEFGSQIVLGVVPPLHFRPIVKSGWPRHHACTLGIGKTRGTGPDQKTVIVTIGNKQEIIRIVHADSILLAICAKRQAASALLVAITEKSDSSAISRRTAITLSRSIRSTIVWRQRSHNQKYWKCRCIPACRPDVGTTEPNSTENSAP